MLIAAAGAAQLQCRPFDICRSGQLEFCDEQEPRRNRPWGGGRDRRVRSAPVNFKERAGFVTDFQPGQAPQSCAFVIFGVTGDLTRRLIVPALYNLAAEELLPDKFCVVGVARHGISKDALCEALLKGVREFATRRVEDKIVNRLFECVTPVEADSGDARSFDRLKEQLEGLEVARNTGGNRLFYLATPPDAFAPIARELGRVGLLKEDGGAWRRLVGGKAVRKRSSLGSGAEP
jgi:hypothetical protein